MHRVTKERTMTAQDDRTASTAVASAAPATPVSPFPTGVGHFFPATAPGVPLSAFAFAFAVGFLGILDTGMLPAAADGMLIATLLGIGTIGLFVGGMWEYRAGELFGGTFGLGYAGFLFSTGLFYKFFYGPLYTAAGANNTNHVLAAWFIMWAIFTGIFAIGARTIALAAVAPFTLAFVVLVLTVISEFGGVSSWATDFLKAAGWAGILDGLAAGYLGAALLINTCYAKSICPLFPAKPRG
jgi:succinate-acetate transporter protein